MTERKGSPLQTDLRPRPDRMKISGPDLLIFFDYNSTLGGGIISGPDILSYQVGASGWFVRVNLFARSQNRWFGGLVVWWFRRDRVYRKGLLYEIKRCFAMRHF